MRKIFHKYNEWILIGLTGGVVAVAYLFLLKQTTSLHGFDQIPVLGYLWILFCFCTWLLWRRVIKRRLKGYSTRWNLLWFLGSLAGGLWLANNIPLFYPGSLGSSTAVPIINKVIFLGSSGIAIGLLLFVAIIFLAGRRTSPYSLPAQDEMTKQQGEGGYSSLQTAEKGKKLRWLVYALPMISVWVVYLLAFWPGMMSADSMDQWGQMLTGQYVDHHPAFHTFTIWLLTRIYPSPAVVALAQIIALGLVAGAILAYFEKLGVRRWMLWLAVLLFAVTPVNGTMVNTLWKDIPYSTALLGFTFLVFKLVQTKGQWISQKWSWFILGITSALVMLIRYNGPPIILGVFVLLIAFFYRQWKPLMISAALAAGLFFGIRGPVFQLVHVAPSSDLVDWTTSLYKITMQSSPGTASAAVIDEMSPINLNWDCSILTKVNQAYQAELPITNVSFSQEAVNLVAHIPNLLIYNYRCLRSLVWVIWDPNGLVLNASHVQVLDDPNPFGIVPDSKIPAMRDAIAEFVVNTSSNTGINWLVWRPALYLYVFLFIIAIQAARNRNPLLLLATAPILLQSIGSTMILINPNFRYHYAAYLMAFIFWPLLFNFPSPVSKGLNQENNNT